MKRKAAERLADLLDPNRVLREAARLAFADIRELFDEAGNVKPIHDWPAPAAAAVAAVDVVLRKAGGPDQVMKLRLFDKPKALELLMKHLGLLNPATSGPKTMEQVVVRIVDECAPARLPTKSVLMLPDLPTTPPPDIALIATSRG